MTNLSDLRQAAARICALHREATPPPWDSVISHYSVRYLGPNTGDTKHGDYVANLFEGPSLQANKDFIAASRTDAPLLAQGVLALLEAIEMELDIECIVRGSTSPNGATREQVLERAAAILQDRSAAREEAASLCDAGADAQQNQGDAHGQSVLLAMAACIRQLGRN